MHAATKSEAESTDSLHTQFAEYVRTHARELDISGRPPVPSSLDMALMMERQWEEVRLRTPLQAQIVDDRTRHDSITELREIHAHRCLT
jgi:hypothetical protein